ncbi:9769_t:CDS:2, partial [Acaulospora morrowiae]
IPVSQQQTEYQFLLEKQKNEFQNALAQQKTEYQSLLEKQKAEFQAQMIQQPVAQKEQIPLPQIIRQPKGPPSSLNTEEGIKNHYLTKYLNDLGIFSKESFDSNYPIKPFQRPHAQQSNVSTRIDIVEDGINETRNAVNQLTKEFQKLNIPKDNTAKSNLKRSYFTPLKPIYPQKKELIIRVDMMKKTIYENKRPETYDELLPKLSPAMRKMCLSRRDWGNESKKSDEWFSSLQYLHCNINDLSISESFLDPGSEFGSLNDSTINALGWEADNLSNFNIKGSSKHITESLGWFTDVPVSIKDKNGKTVTATGKFTRIDNGEPEPMLCLTWIRKVQ